MTRRSWCCLVFVFHGDPARSSFGVGSRRFEKRARPGLFSNLEPRKLQTQFPPSTVKLRSCREYGVRRRHSDASAANANPSAIPINGLSAANQKETFQPRLSAVRFLFIPSFKFSKPEISEEFSQVLPSGAYAFQTKGQKILGQLSGAGQSTRLQYFYLDATGAN